MDQRIVCAAIRNKNGFVICGPRHYDETMHQHISTSTQDWCAAEQGFVDQHGNFLTRTEAYPIALAAGQIVRQVGGGDGKLFSEHLY